MNRLFTRLTTNRFLLRAIYYPWILLPYPVRRVVTTAGIWGLLLLRRVRGIHRRQDPTPPGEIFALSFWRVPHVEVADYSLAIDGRVGRPTELTFDELTKLPAVERSVTLDCVGGSRNNCVMRGVPLQALLELVQPQSDAETAVFHCGDGFFTTHPIEDLIETEAFMAYSVNGRYLPAHGHPLRLVAPGKYGYKWAKWVARMELASGSPKGYWERRGLPDRAWVGDVR